MSCDTFTYTIFIGASPDKIWDALTSTEHTFQYWSGRSIESDWQVGATIEMHKPDGNLEWHGTIKKCDPSKEMIYTWELVDAYENGWMHPL